MKYDASMSWDERTVSALEGAFRSEVRARRVNGPHRDVIVSLDGAEFLVRWLTTGWHSRGTPRHIPARHFGCTHDVSWCPEGGT